MKKLINSNTLREMVTLGITFEHRAIVLVRQDNKAYAYENRCPHLQVNLEFQPNVFLDHSEQYLQCSTHGALFNINDGYCVWGPCTGQSLAPIKIQEFDGAIWLV